jgi:hypothetical protein
MPTNLVAIFIPRKSAIKPAPAMSALASISEPAFRK